ncbi:hypothetical protein BLA29_013721 [Euroglyphus maynei]|nr:hypothetical protein BLA29_013721 [Euroglyphus maynei]
MINYMY